MSSTFASRPARRSPRRAAVAGLVAALTVAGLPALAPSAAASTDDAPQAATLPSDQQALGRIAGANRYETATELSTAFFPGQAKVVYLATGAAFPDALGAGPAASVHGAPLLLVGRDALPPAVEAELRRLDPEHLVVLGGPSAISDAVTTAAAGAATADVRRVAGSDRYATAAAVSEQAFHADVPLLFVATGAGFADALAAGAAAARVGAPLLLVAPNAVPAATARELARLSPERIVLAGGTAVISDAVERQLASSGASVTRIFGADRYGTSAQLTLLVGGSSVATFVATGQDWPDALAAAPIAGLTRSALVLTPSAALGPVAQVMLMQQNPALTLLLGGGRTLATAVHDGVVETFPGIDHASETSGSSTMALPLVPIGVLVLKWLVGIIVSGQIEAELERRGAVCHEPSIGGVNLEAMLDGLTAFGDLPERLQKALITGFLKGEDAVSMILPLLTCVTPTNDSVAARPPSTSPPPDPVPAPRTPPPSSGVVVPIGPKVVSGGLSLRLRADASTSAPVVGALRDGQRVTVLCTKRGETVQGRWGSTDLWNYLSAGGYASDGFIYTGTNAPIAPPCAAEPPPPPAPAPAPEPVAGEGQQAVTHYDCANDNSNRGRYVGPGRYWENPFTAAGAVVTGGSVALGAAADGGDHRARIGIYRGSGLRDPVVETEVSVSGYDGESFAFPAVAVAPGEQLFLAVTGIGGFTVYDSAGGCMIAQVLGYDSASEPSSTGDRGAVVSYDRMAPGAPFHGYFEYAHQSFTAASNRLALLGVTVGNPQAPSGGEVGTTLRVRLCRDAACTSMLAEARPRIVNYGETVADIGAVPVTPGETYFVRWEQPAAYDGRTWVTYWWGGTATIGGSDQMQMRVRGHNA